MTKPDSVTPLSQASECPKPASLAETIPLTQPSRGTGKRMGTRKALPSGANRALLLGHASRLTDRRLNLDIRPFNRRQLTGSLWLQQPGIIGIYQHLARMRIL